MARTPLLRAVRRLAQEHEAAANRGIALTELRRRRSAELSRREFIAGAVAIGALSATLPRPQRGPLHSRASPSSGPASPGLAAALALHDKGLAATVYEASSRIGGRMHSDRGDYWADNQSASSAAS